MSAVIWSLSQRQLETLRDIATAAGLGGALADQAPRYPRMIARSMYRRGMLEIVDGRYQLTEYGAAVLSFVDLAQCKEAAAE
jgi:hypothetical protein